jgi:hypothetical protein
MTPHRILQLNALSTAACALGMLVTRGALFSLFGLTGPLLMDLIAVGLLVYAGALAAASRQERISRPTLMFFTIADAAWVAGSAVVLLLFWAELAPIARLLVIAVAVIVDVFATLQFRAAGRATGHTPQMA